MKKSIFVLGLAALLVVACAATAFASTTSGPLTWDPNSAANNANLPTPHKDYVLSTQKCAVCHQAHKADGAAGNEMLLGTTVADACSFCHLSATGVGLDQPYNGDTAVWEPAVEANTAHNGTAGTGLSCTSCHSVHGANTITIGTAGNTLDAAILRVQPGGLNPVGGGADFNFNAGQTQDGAESNFCTACHPYWNGLDGTHVGSQFPAPADNTVYQGHPMVAATANFAGAGNNLPANSTVAWANSNYCRDCHDAGGTNEGNGQHPDNFPHATTAVRFMTSANNVQGNGNRNAQSSQEDGVCLKCHVSGAALGVGKTF